MPLRVRTIVLFPTLRYARRQEEGEEVRGMRLYNQGIKAIPIPGRRYDEVTLHGRVSGAEQRSMDKRQNTNVEIGKTCTSEGFDRRNKGFVLDRMSNSNIITREDGWTEGRRS